MIAFGHGAFLALGLILPLGVQNVFIFNQGASHRSFVFALPAVITASLCDTLLITLSVSGLSLLIFNFMWLKSMILIIGSVFLIYMGWTIWKSAVLSNNVDWKPLSSKEQIAFALTVSLLNPHAILDTIGVIGTSSIVYAGQEKALFTIGCILVSWVWFFTLSLAGRVVGKLNSSIKILKWINYFSSIIIWVIAIMLLLQGIKEINNLL